MANFLEDVGSFFKNLGTGITGTVQGFAGNLQSQGQLNLANAEALKAQADLMRANAEATQLRLRLDAENKKRQQEIMLYALIVIAAVPIAGMILYYSFKK